LTKTCTPFQHIYYRYEEIDLENRYWNNKNGLYVEIQFSGTQKEIIQVREVDLHILTGNVGGYIGLIHGFTLLPFPDFLEYIRGSLKEKFRAFGVPKPTFGKKSKEMCK